MAKAKDSEIEQRLRKVVRTAVKNGEEVTLRSARSKVEKELGLEVGFLKSDEKWKTKSKEIVHAAVVDTEEPKPEAPSSSISVLDPTPSEPSKASGKKEKSKPQSKQVSTPVSAKSPKKAAPPPPPAPVVQTKTVSSESSEESESGSDNNDDADSEVEAAKVPTPKKPEKEPARVNGVKRKASDVSASDSSSDESESEEGSDDDDDEPKQKKAKTNTTSDDSSSEDESESEAEKEDEPDKMDTTPPKPSASESIPKPLASIPAKAYEPPTGYTSLDTATLPTNPAFSTSNLTGKELWHITLPSTLHLSSLTTISLSSLQSTTPLLSHNGNDYTLSEHTSNLLDTTTLLLPTAHGYQKCPQPLTRHLQIQQKISLPNLTLRQSDPLTGSSAAAQIAQAAVRSVPSQPKGLRMRYKPPGFGGGKLGKIGESSTESEEEDAPAPEKSSFQFPKALGAHAASVQQGTNEVLREEGERSGKKKRRKEKEGRRESGVGEMEDVSASPIVSSETPAKSKASGSKMSNDDTPGDLGVSKEERAKRKEERRLKKAARAAQAA